MKAEENSGIRKGSQRLSFLPRDPLLELFHADDSIEVQADQAAHAFLMPSHLVRQTNSPEDLALRCVVLIREARIRFSQVKTGPKRTPSIIQNTIDADSRAGRVSAAEYEDQAQRNARAERETIARLDQERAQLWEQLPKIVNEDPNEFRKARGWRVRRSEYLKMTQCGWKIHHGEICAYLDQMGE